MTNNRQRKITPEEKNLWNAAMNGGTKVPPSLPPNIAPISIPKTKLPTRLPPPSTTLDCHGMTLNEAYQATMAHISGWRGRAKSLVVITGKSGTMCLEFPGWVSSHKDVSKVEQMNGGGAFRLRLKKV